jgi:translation initiation factor IF-3
MRDDAIQRAKEEGLDLVLVGGGNPPTCKIMDYGRHLYQQKKRAKKNSSHSIKTKEIKIGFQSDDNYVGIKTSQARNFLEKGNRVKVTIKFRGREGAHIDMMVDKCKNIYSDLSDVSEMEAAPTRSGRNVTMMLVPKK